MGSHHIIVHKVKKSHVVIFVKTENCEGGSWFWNRQWWSKWNH